MGVFGAAAHRARRGDKLIIVCYAILDEAETDFFLPKILLVDADNKIKAINKFFSGESMAAVKKEAGFVWKRIFSGKARPREGLLRH